MWACHSLWFEHHHPDYGGWWCSECCHYFKYKITSLWHTVHLFLWIKSIKHFNGSEVFTSIKNGWGNIKESKYKVGVKVTLFYYRKPEEYSENIISNPVTHPYTAAHPPTHSLTHCPFSAASTIITTDTPDWLLNSLYSPPITSHFYQLTWKHGHEDSSTWQLSRLKLTVAFRLICSTAPRLCIHIMRNHSPYLSNKTILIIKYYCICHVKAVWLW